jgi:hypothetical protein
MDWSNLFHFGGIHDLYQSLIRLRRNWDNTTAGLKGEHVIVCHINNTDKVIAYHRWDNGGPGDDVVVVINVANKSYSSYAKQLKLKNVRPLSSDDSWSDDYYKPGHLKESARLRFSGR